jgi:hypothetical protein
LLIISAIVPLVWVAFLREPSETIPLEGVQSAPLPAGREVSKLTRGKDEELSILQAEKHVLRGLLQQKKNYWGM